MTLQALNYLIYLMTMTAQVLITNNKYCHFLLVLKKIKKMNLLMWDVFNYIY